MSHVLGVDTEKIRAAIGARRFPIARIVQHGAGARLCDCAGQKAAGVVRIVMVENRVRIALLVDNRERGAVILIGASAGEIPSLSLPRRMKSKSPYRAIGLLLDRHRH